MNKLIIIPDVHGRTFWKEIVYNALENEPETDIVFLGDYVDPYEYEGIFPEDGIAALEEVIDIKKKYANTPETYHRVTLLIGNHDLGYLWPSICQARRSRKYASDIYSIFSANFSLFDLAYECEFKGKKYLLSHAGIHKEWYKFTMQSLNIPIKDYDNIALKLNNIFHIAVYEDIMVECLGIYSYFRGYSGSENGSCVWADVREWSDELGNVEKNAEMGFFQIFGHTQLEIMAIVKDTFACLDVRRPFILTEDNILIDPKYPIGEWEYNLNKEQ